MCFQMTYHVDYVEEPDVKQKFEVIDAGGPKPSIEELRSYVKTAAKLWISNHVIAKAVEIAAASGRVQAVTTPGDVPEIWERGILFTATPVAQCLIEVAHREVMWVDHHIQLSNKVIMIQLKDFSFAAMVSFGDIRDDQEPMGENALIRQECRIKFGLDAEQAITYQLPEGWLEVEIAKARKIF